MRSKTPTGSRAASCATLANPSRRSATPQAPPVEDDGATTGFPGVRIGELKRYRLVHDPARLETALAQMPGLSAAVVIMEQAEILLEVTAREKTVEFLHEFCREDFRRGRTLGRHVVATLLDGTGRLPLDGENQSRESLRAEHREFVASVDGPGRLQGFKGKPFSLSLDESDFLRLVVISEKLGISMESMIRAGMEKKAESIRRFQAAQKGGVR